MSAILGKRDREFIRTIENGLFCANSSLSVGAVQRLVEEVECSTAWHFLIGIGNTEGDVMKGVR